MRWFVYNPGVSDSFFFYIPMFRLLESDFVKGFSYEWLRLFMHVGIDLAALVAWLPSLIRWEDGETGTWLNSAEPFELLILCHFRRVRISSEDLPTILSASCFSDDWQPT